ncbi:Vacuolar protein sorting-associated protein 72, partial [Coemansia erecta]
VIGARKAKNGESAAAPLPVRVSSRTSAVRKAQETEALEQEREFMAEIKRSRKGHKRSREEDSTKLRALTQEQLLEEAKQTEIENLEKLQTYQEIEAEDKRQQRRMASRKTPLIIRPVAHFRSFSEKINVNDKQSEVSRVVRTEYALEKLDDSNYPLNPWKHKVSVYPLKICPVTGLPARYFHPKARVPYANARAYRVLEDMVLGEHAFFYDIGAWSSTAIADN